MQSSNFQRMMQLAEDVFEARTDPEQLDVNQEVLEKLEKIHPSTLSDYVDGDGPVVWILLIPVTTEVMQKFLKQEITEKQLYEMTEAGQKFEAVYLCSALVLPEFRKKGLARKTALEALHKIRLDYPIRHLFVWPFSNEGEQLAASIAKEAGLPLWVRC